MPLDHVEAWHRVRAVLLAFKDFTELPPSSNRGQVVDRLVAFAGYDPKDAVAWCACAVYYAGFHGLLDDAGRSAWPLKKTGGCQDLADYAKAKAVLVDKPEVGDVFLVWYETLNGKPARRFGHTGFIMKDVGGGSFETLEGNTSKMGDTDPKTQREGWGWFSRTRKFKPADRFVRWSSLL